MTSHSPAYGNLRGIPRIMDDGDRFLGSGKKHGGDDIKQGPRGNGP